MFGLNGLKGEGEKQMVTKTSMPAVTRTSAGLRDALFDELDRMRSGETSASSANALARLSDQICNTIRMEIEVHKHLGRLPADRQAAIEMPEPLALGRRVS